MRVIDMRPVKRFAHNRLPGSPIREVLLVEEDKLDADTFLARLPVWLNLINMSDLGK